MYVDVSHNKFQLHADCFASSNRYFVSIVLRFLRSLLLGLSMRESVSTLTPQLINRWRIFMRCFCEDNLKKGWNLDRELFSLQNNVYHTLHIFHEFSPLKLASIAFGHCFIIINGWFLVISKVNLRKNVAGLQFIPVARNTLKRTARSRSNE